MRKKIFALLLLTTHYSVFTIAQSYDANHAPNEYRSKSNPLYWKNRMPFAGYWQQDVYYKIDAVIHEDSDIISGNETLKYWNNSPDTLNYVFFHLYQNMTIKGGYQADLVRANHVKEKFGHYEEQGLGCVMSSIKSNGQDLKTEWDVTLVKVYLTKPLMPNDSVSFDITFKTYWDNGSERRRFKKFNAWGYTHYDGVHWYPRICVYDRKFGWDTNQHLGKEFYGDFGTYEVSLDFANNFVVEATGTLQNESEMLPAELRKQLDMSNFFSKKWESEPSVIIPYVKGVRKVWKYYAENVHDFAFTADPTYRIGETKCLPAGQAGNGIRIIAMCQEPHCIGWQGAVNFAASVIKTYSQDFGMYAWPKFVFCDAQDGMEYNMLNLDGGFEPYNHDLIAHEGGHEWFYGMVGNNETYRASLDEGFTQFIESWSMIKLQGQYMPERKQKGYVGKFTEPLLVRDGEVYLGYMGDAIKNADEPLNTHSDAFNSALGHGGGYRHVYFKTATMLWNLQYVLGDSLFRAAMSHYFNQWKFCHPYFEDFRNSIIQFTHVDLNWFFDEWMETTKNIDYKISSVKKVAGTSDKYEITFKRKGRMQMPIDFSVETKDGKTSNYTIPNTWYPKKSDATVLPKWYGWDKLESTYTATVTSSSKIKNVVIDPSNRLADIYMPDNSWKCSTKWKFDSQISNSNDWKHYIVKWRPDLWYNAVDGIKPGFHFEGDYMRWRHIFDFNVWWNSTLLQNQTFHYDRNEEQLSNVFPVSFSFDYKDNIKDFPKYVNWNLDLKNLDGLRKEKIGLEFLAGSKDVLNIYFQSLSRHSEAEGDRIWEDTRVYLLYNDEWTTNALNNSLNFDWKHNFAYIGGNTVLKMNLRAAALWSATNYSWLNAELINHNKLGRFDIDTRVFAQYSTGTLPEESKLWLSGNNPEGMLDDKFTRSIGYFPAEWTTFGSTINHFQDGGGLNLRGYAGYLAPEILNGEVVATYKGNSGASVSAEIQFDRLFSFAPKFTKNSFKFEPYIFGDAGCISISQDEKNYLMPLRADAGLGTLFTIKRFFKLDEIKPFTIRADFPLFISSLPYEETNYLAFRWMIGVGKSF